MSVLARLLQRADDEPIVIEPSCGASTSADMLPIEQDAYPKPWSRAVFESEFEQVRSGSRHYVVARRRRVVIGYAGLWISPDPAGDQGTSPTSWSPPTTGVVASPPRLLGSLADEAIERGCVALTLEVRVSSTGAQELYRRFGFAPAGVRKRYYENTEDAIVMWCHDIQTEDYARRLRRAGRRRL